MCLHILKVHFKKKKSAKDYQMMLILCFCVFPDFLYKSICCGYSFELHRQVDAIQMGTHNICLFKGSIFLKNRHLIIQERFNKLRYGINTIIKCDT